MKIYITMKFKFWENKNEIEELSKFIRDSWHIDFCFIRDIENYKKIFNNSYELMLRAKEEIQNCDALLIDYDWPGTWRIVELWMAYALWKKVILIAKKWTFIKETIEWVTDLIIEYEKLEDIIQKLKNF